MCYKNKTFGAILSLDLAKKCYVVRDPESDVTFVDSRLSNEFQSQLVKVWAEAEAQARHLAGPNKFILFKVGKKNEPVLQMTNADILNYPIDLTGVNSVI